MKRLKGSSSIWKIVVMLALMALIAAACSSSSDDTTTTAASGDTEATTTTAASGDTEATTTTAATATTEGTADFGEVTLAHYYGSSLGQQAIDDIDAGWSGGTVVISPIEHEAFKDAILVQLAGGEPPDVFSYWAGARTKSVQGNGYLIPIDDVFEAAGVMDSFPPAIAEAGIIDGTAYLLPFGYHYVAFFYNPEVMASAGITDMPTTWDELNAAADKLVAAGVKPFALGSLNRWPAQFWFDYSLLRTAGPEFRAGLMAGTESYDSPEVAEAMELWKSAVDAGYFVDDANAYDWTDAADQVANGEAAMTLMGTWITGYWDSTGLVAGTDYDFFPFPEVTPGVPAVALGPVDGWVVTKDAKNPEGAKALLEYYATPEVQAKWAVGQGALAPNAEADTSTQNDVMKKAGATIAGAPVFNFNYDLATPPEAAEFGLDMFQAFMDDPTSYPDLLTMTQEDVQKALGN
jgi:multiple sugar transport system substrate-binding protein/raffinose/stachyose/melibiose transport system substrate-binding protein